MINHIRGSIDYKGDGRLILEAGGIGYEIFVASASLDKLPPQGGETKIYVSESTAMYGGATTLYGFVSEEEREIFLLLREHVPGAGAKKALEYLDKITKSLPDFSRAVTLKDAGMLVTVFGFTKKTADKLITSLKDKVGQLPAASAPGKWAPRTATGVLDETISALVALGFREAHARSAAEEAVSRAPDAKTEALIRDALQYLSQGK